MSEADSGSLETRLAPPSPPVAPSTAKLKYISDALKSYAVALSAAVLITPAFEHRPLIGLIFAPED